jgi:hypothetical protein
MEEVVRASGRAGNAYGLFSSSLSVSDFPSGSSSTAAGGVNFSLRDILRRDERKQCPYGTYSRKFEPFSIIALRREGHKLLVGH